MKRTIRRGMEIVIPLLGMGIIFGSVLFGPNSLQLQVLLVLIGVLILEAGVWGPHERDLPSERRYLACAKKGIIPAADSCSQRGRCRERRRPGRRHALS